jgi:ribosomal protein S18 acetylase RimI-like enzyme
MGTPSTNDFETARQWADELLGPGSPVAFFLAPARFVSATRTRDSLSITLGDDESFGMALGPAPLINPRWGRFFVGEQSTAQLPDHCRAVDRWNFYSLDTSAWIGGARARIVSDDDVFELLRNDAPDSSIWPGNPEIVHWYAIRDANASLASLGALVQWESGYHVVASIVTARKHRGEGLAQQLTGAIVTAAQEMGIQWLGLGVSSENSAAQHVYEKTGFLLRARFTVYVAGEHDPELSTT